ncbi:Signal-peptide peptidase, presenilin aspartyl protease [Candidatus Bilamarchaeum dharawalense]|uniref:Signal-peptide peptidase, presenilin aspartyl protease n=1 Tax=Candidatus Bilamarchaeum dharawalense TaxID=2885759 RepID=A0A5E4LPN2_9ARCH|nr:Signal-peptide peptidase, presenilin aspartyl protease [Candidatus Bilamarchaeum dharawalense]
MRLLVSMLCLFIIAQVVGLYTGNTIIKDIDQNPYVNSMVVTNNADDPMNAVFFILYILLGAVVMVLLIRKFTLFPIVFRAMEFLMIASASSIAIYALLRMVFDYDVSTSAAIILSLIFSALRLKYPALKNAAAIMATAGVGTIFGVSLGLVPLILFLIFLSIYDFLAVFKTKHMVEMANFVVQKDFAFTVTAKAPPEKMGQKEQRIDLGTGDMIAPVMLEVATMAWNPVATVFVFIGAVVSFGLFIGFVYKKKMVLPALPPIVAGMVVSLLLGMLLGFY